MLLPFPYFSLKKNLGVVLRRARRRKALKQAVVSYDAGISRGALSMIEAGRTPRLQTLDRLMEVLDLEWHDIAERGNSGSFRPFTEGFRGDWLVHTGQELRRRRKAQGMSLARLANLLGLSASTLSRLEMGELPRSRVFKDMMDFEHVPFDERPFEVVHPGLAAFLSI